MDTQAFLDKARAAYEERTAQEEAQHREHMQKVQAELRAALQRVLGVEVGAEAFEPDAAHCEIAGVMFRTSHGQLYTWPVNQPEPTLVSDMYAVWEWADVWCALNDTDEEPTVYRYARVYELNEAVADGREFEVILARGDDLLIRYTDVAQRDRMVELEQFLGGRLNALDDALRGGDVEAARDTIQACIDEIAGVVY
jgi:hypothetical protein